MFKNRKWNDWITNWTRIYPIFSSLDKYRPNHLKHHQNLNTEDDPDWVARIGKRAFTFPKRETEFFWTLGSNLVFYQGISDAIWFLKRFNNVIKKVKGDKSKKYPVIAFYLILNTCLTIFGGWKIFLL